MFSNLPDTRTRVVSLNTDSIVIQVTHGDQAAVDAAVSDWERTFGFTMERTEVLAHRGLNINTYLEVVREGGGPPELKSKGALAHDPGISADHDRLIVAQAVGQWMLSGADVADYIRAAAARREILRFTEMRSAPSSGLRLDGRPIGRICRVYRSTRHDLPQLTRDATAKAAQQILEAGFAYLEGVQWPAQDDVDVDWYILQAVLLIAQTAVPYSPHHNALAAQLQALGLKVAGVGGAATALGAGGLDLQARATGTETNPRNHSGDRALAVSVAKTKGLVAVQAADVSPSSLVLAYGHTDGRVMGELHSRVRLAEAKVSVRELRKQGAVVDSGFVTVYDPAVGLVPLHAGLPAEPVAAQQDGSASGLGGELGTQSFNPATLDNDTYLQVVFGQELDHAFVCSHTTPPDDPDRGQAPGVWSGGPVRYAKGLYQLPERQNYTCVSTFEPDEAGVYRRRQEHFLGLHAVVLDDIGTKVTVDPRKLGFGEPTLVNETSPGNQQWVYRLREPLRDLAQATYLVKEVLARSVQGHLLTDQGARGVTRLYKLPVGSNLKRSLGQPWRNQVLHWRPEVAYDAQQIASWFGADLDSAPSLQVNALAAAQDAAEHPLIHALQEAGMLKTGAPKATGWWDIRCQQVGLHSNGDESGTAVKIKADGSWTMSCAHGHCQSLTPRDLYRFLAEQGHHLTPPQLKLNVQRLDRTKLQFGPSEDGGLPAAEDEFAFMSPDDGGADEEVVYPDPEEQGAPGGAGGRGGGGLGHASNVAGPGGTGAPASKPEIFIEPGLLHRTVSECAQVLDHVVFKRGPVLARIGRGCELSDGLTRTSTQPVVVTVTRQWLVRELTERATFKRWDKRTNDYKVVDCPVNVAATVESGTDDDTFRPLTALASTPFLRSDGSLCTAPGYDDATGIYYAPNLIFPPVPNQPTWQQARLALDELAALVRQFPFASPAALSVFLADVLTAVARPTLSKSPAVLYSATMAGTGKTLMASIPNLIAYGHATTHPWPHGNEEELRKLFTSVLQAGDPVVVFDNLPNGSVIKSAALSQFVTSDDYADRKLGETQRLRFKNRTRVVLTGNNVTLASDNARRTLVCELQLQVESPRDRGIEFDIPDLAAHIKLNRASLIVAALTVLRAYAIVAQPLRLAPLESFEDWSWRVRDALVWLGHEDPVAAVQFENDGTGETAEAFAEIEAAAQVKRAKPPGAPAMFRANDLVTWAASNYRLRDALEAAGCGDCGNAGKVGYWLRSLKNRIAGGRRLSAKAVDGGRQASQWVVEPVMEPVGEG